MKKRIAFLLAVVMLLSMAACAAKETPRIIPRQKRPQKPARPSWQIPAK